MGDMLGRIIQQLRFMLHHQGENAKQTTQRQLCRLGKYCRNRPIQPLRTFLRNWSLRSARKRRE